MCRESHVIELRQTINQTHFQNQNYVLIELHLFSINIYADRSKEKSFLAEWIYEIIAVYNEKQTKHIKTN